MIAVVGATGNTGRSVVKELKQLGRDPICVVPWAWKTCQRPLSLRAVVSLHNDKIRDRVRLSHGPKHEFGGVTINSPQPLSLPGRSRRCQST